MPVCWKARAILPKLDAQRLTDALEQLEPMPIISAFELGERSLWEVNAFFAHEPSEEDLLKHTGVAMRILPVPEENWVARALEGLPPVRTAHFFIYGEHSAKLVPANAIGLKIEASTAFGTGHHGTTRGCLLAFEHLARYRRFKSVLDLGCGTGVLAMAFARLTHNPVVATDIDLLAVVKTRENARLNRTVPHLRIARADGFRARTITENAPYDLIFANILAGPLMRLMPGIRAHLAPGGIAILSGLLDEQTNGMLAMARAHGLRLARRAALEGWVTLVLKRSGARKP